MRLVAVDGADAPMIPGFCWCDEPGPRRAGSKHWTEALRKAPRMAVGSVAPRITWRGHIGAGPDTGRGGRVFTSTHGIFGFRLMRLGRGDSFGVPTNSASRQPETREKPPTPERASKGVRTRAECQLYSDYPDRFSAAATWLAIEGGRNRWAVPGGNQNDSIHNYPILRGVPPIDFGILAQWKCVVARCHYTRGGIHRNPVAYYPDGMQSIESIESIIY